MAARLHALGNHHVDARLLNGQGLVQIGGAGQGDAAIGFERRQKIWLGQAEMKTHHRRALRQDQLLQRRIAQGRGVHRLQAGGRGGTKTGKFRGQVLQPGLFTLGIGLRVLVVEQIDVERPAGQAVGVLDVGFRLFQAVRTQANRTQRARIAHGGGQLRGGGARHGRLNNGVAQAQALHPWGQSGVGHGKSFCREKLTGRPTRCAARHPGTG